MIYHVCLDTLEGAQVMEDLGCRTFNVRDCTRERWDTHRRTVQCERKATELAKRRTGRYEPYSMESTRHPAWLPAQPSWTRRGAP